MAAKRKYAWEKWLHQPQTILRRGVDYHCSQSSMVQIVRNNVWRRGSCGKVSVIDTGDSVIIKVADDTSSHSNKATVVS